MAYDHNVQLVPHGWNTAIGLAADLHLSAAAAGGPLRRVPDAVAVHRRDRRRRRSRSTPTACSPIPTAPGLGLDLDWDGIRRFAGGTV